MLELFLHCQEIVCHPEALLGFPEVNVPVVPGMEGCHLPFRRTQDGHQDIVNMLLTGKSVTGEKAHQIGLVDLCGDLDLLCDHLHDQRDIRLNRKSLLLVLDVDLPLNEDSPRGVIARSIVASCLAEWDDALAVQAEHSGEFMVSPMCRRGRIGGMAKKKKVLLPGEHIVTAKKAS